MTGGTGFIGSNICNLLVKKNFNVKIYDNNFRGSFNKIRKIRKKMGQTQSRSTQSYAEAQMGGIEAGLYPPDERFQRPRMEVAKKEIVTPGQQLFPFIATGEQRKMVPTSVLFVEQRIKQSMNPFVRALQPEFDVLARSSVFDDKTEIEKNKLLRELMREERDRLAKTPLDEIRKQDKLLHGRI